MNKLLPCRIGSVRLTLLQLGVDVKLSKGSSSFLLGESHYLKACISGTDFDDRIQDQNNEDHEPYEH